VASGTAVLHDDESWKTEEAKKAFAKALLFSPDDAYKAAKQVVLDNPGRALWIAQFWLSDPVVLQEQQDLIKLHGELYFLPNKAQTARKAWLEVEKAKTSAERQGALKLYASIMGHIDDNRSSGGNTINNNVNNNFVGDNKVMVVVSHGTKEQWEEKAINSQAALVDSAQEDIARDIALMEASKGDDDSWVFEAKRA